MLRHQKFGISALLFQIKSTACGFLFSLLLWWQKKDVLTSESLINVRASELFPDTHGMNIAKTIHLSLLYDEQIPTLQNLYLPLITNNHVVMRAELHFGL